MIDFKNTIVMNMDGAIRGMRNPLESWYKSDSYWTHIVDAKTLETAKYDFFVGENDLNLMKRLCKAGSDHRKFLRQIFVTVDITAPLYWWKEFDTYKVGTVANSCSTMHKIHAKEFTIFDFSCEYLEYRKDENGMELSKDILEWVISTLNFYREQYNITKDKKYWYQMIQLLPSSYNQKRTVTLNYEVLRNIYHSRCNHKLDEWHAFCKWIEDELPYAKDLIIGE